MQKCCEKVHLIALYLISTKKKNKVWKKKTKEKFFKICFSCDVILNKINWKAIFFPDFLLKCLNS